MKCMGKNCPLGFKDISKCTVHNCEDRTKLKTNFDRIKMLDVEEASHELTELFYRVAQYSNAEHYIKEWLQKECEG